MVTGLKPRSAINYSEKQILVDNILRGKGLFPNIVENIAQKVVDHYLPVSYWRRKAKEEKYKFSDFLIMNFTTKVRNTKIARKMYKNRVIKPYGENEEWIRILK